VSRRRLLVLCTGNRARSQMAEGLVRHYHGGRFEVESAGTMPGRVFPEAIAVMAELGIDISGQRSKHVDELAGRSFDYVLTVCDYARETCPVFPGALSFHHQIADPAGVGGSEAARLAEFRRARDELRAYLDAWVPTLAELSRESGPADPGRGPAGPAG
jgi:arsenate reductase